MSKEIHTIFETPTSFLIMRQSGQHRPTVIRAIAYTKADAELILQMFEEAAEASQIALDRNT